MKYAMGNLLTLADKGHFDVIVHGCNCFVAMGAGVAAAIAQRAPQAYDADKTTLRGDRKKLGTYTSAIVDDDRCITPYTIVNAYTQYTAWDVDDMLDYNAVKNVFERIKADFDAPGQNLRIGIPLIGAGLAQGDWNRLEQIIDECGFTNLVAVVFDQFHLDKIKRDITVVY